MASPEPASVLESQALLEEIQRPFEPELPGGWCLSSAMRHHEGGVLLVVTHPEQRATLGLQVRVTEDDAPAWLRTAHLDLISHIPEDTPESEGLHILEPLASRLKALDTDDRRWRAASALGDVAPEVAAERYGFVGNFIGVDNPTSSAQTQELLGSVIPDLN